MTVLPMLNLMIFLFRIVLHLGDEKYQKFESNRVLVKSFVKTDHDSKE
jgi:hypothetical protein